MSSEDFKYLWTFTKFYSWEDLFAQWQVASQLNFSNVIDNIIEAAIIGNSLNLKDTKSIFKERKSFKKKLLNLLEDKEIENISFNLSKDDIRKIMVKLIKS